MDEIVATLRMIISTWKHQGYFGSHPECKRTEFLRHNDLNISGAISAVRQELEAAGLTIVNYQLQKPNDMLDLIVVEAR